MHGQAAERTRANRSRSLPGRDWRRAGAEGNMKNQIELECQKCRKPFRPADIADLFFWNNRTGFEAGNIYCLNCEDSREKAPLVKPQPKRIEGRNYVAGWDV